MSTDSSDDARDPDRFPLADDAGQTTGDDGTGATPGASPPDEGSTAGNDGMGTRGWVLVAVVLVSFFVVPTVILFRPPALPFEAAFLVLPLLPAFLLGGTALWAMAGRAE